MMIKAEDVMRVRDAVLTLQRTKQVFEEDTDLFDPDADELDDNALRRLEACVERDEAGVTIKDCIVYHKQMPMALGSGAASTLRKIK